MREPVWLVLHVPFSWTVNVVFEFDDNNYIQVWESYDRFAKLQICRRIQWSYHYGRVMAKDELGYATQGSPDDPLEIRIDTCGGEPHLHYRQREPHYSQDQVRGLIKTVLKHRSTKKTFQKLMGFKLSNGE